MASTKTRAVPAHLKSDSNNCKMTDSIANNHEQLVVSDGELFASQESR